MTAYDDTIAGVKNALIDVVSDFNNYVRDYTAPLEKKEQACRGGLNAQTGQ